VVKSIGKRRPVKPQKPHRDFPLFPHPNGLWAKKINGRAWYFGPWKDDRHGQAALGRYLAEKDAILAGQDPRAIKVEGYSLGRLCNDFLNKKKSDMAAGKIKARHYADLFEICKRLIEVFGAGKLAESIGPSDFERLEFSYPSTWGLRRRKREIGGTKSVFNYAARQEKIPKTRFGEYVLPSKDELDKERKANERQHGNREFTPEQLRTIIDAAPIPLKAMILLGVNAGYGNTDCSELTLPYLDLERGWSSFPRPKTGIDRKAALWPETVAAVRDAIAKRPQPKNPDDGNRVFITSNGLRWVRTETSKDEDGKITVALDDSISKQFRTLLQNLKIFRRGLSFYSLRHCCETHGGIDQIAIDRVMGHVSPGMSENYRQSFSDDRLRAVSASIHSWLFGDQHENNKV
jgi:integrase